MKTAKQRFNQRFATFKANLDGKLFINGKFRGRMILEDMVSSVEDMAPGESWSLGRTDDGDWVILHREGRRHAAEWIVSPDESLKSMEGIIPLPDDLRARFDREIKRKSILSPLKAVRLNVVAGYGKTSAMLSCLRLFISHRHNEEHDAWCLDRLMEPSVYMACGAPRLYGLVPIAVSPPGSNK
jgi:hypothetical protein